MMAVLENKRT